ncbi:MAG: DUF429 domain-containing protein [Dehalococcoidia bacterium]|nr:DUF429 domain-containing protein [Dehalococcoidia bacterium]
MVDIAGLDLTAMTDRLRTNKHAKSGTDRECGAVLGIDVGWSAKKRTTGLCLMEWTNQQIEKCFCQATADEDDRRTKLNGLTRGRRLFAIGIDGPLVPNLGLTGEYRAAEAFLSRGKFQQRGKPGPTNGGSGPKLHEEATKLAKLAIDSQDVASAMYPYGIHEKAVVEAFPNAFLAVLHPDREFPLQPQQRRWWTDTLFPRVKHELMVLLEALLPQRSFALDDIEGHEGIASFVCALTALCAVVGRCVAVGNRGLGYIVLPPLEVWGAPAVGNGRWARDALCDNWPGVRGRFTDARLYIDNKLWAP